MDGFDKNEFGFDEKYKGITMYRTMYNQTLVNDSLCECYDIYIMCANGQRSNHHSVDYCTVLESDLVST